MLLNFWKIQAAGNDFIVIDGEDLSEASFRSIELLRWQQICHRRLGIGADGVLWVGPMGAERNQASDVSKYFSLKMIYFNADGREVEMCGNGLRAVAAMASRRERDKKSSSIIGENIAIETLAGVYRATVESTRDNNHFYVQTTFSKVKIFSFEQFKIEGTKILNRYDLSFCRVMAFIDTGVPHLCLESLEDVWEISDRSIYEVGSLIRHDPFFSVSRGVNVNFYSQQKIENRKNKKIYLKVRTFERGVEGETLACGTGVVACVLAHFSESFHQHSFEMNKDSELDLKHLNAEKIEYEVQVKGGLLKVVISSKGIFLSGPADIVFNGRIL